MKPLSLLFLLLLPLLAFAANFTNLPTQVVQPDGSTLDLLASGDEFANRLHDADGYTIMQSPSDGYYYYAVVQGGEPVPSPARADSADPRALGLAPGVNISRAAYRAKVEAMQVPLRNGNRGPNTGLVNNVVIYIKFSDQTEFTETRADYDAKFNAVGGQAYSLRNFFHQASYDQLDYVSHHYPTCAPEVNLSYTDSHPQAYYMPYNSITNPLGYNEYQRTQREHALLANAIASIASQVPVDLNIDADNDQFVDNVCFIIRGPHTAWADLLWAHRWALYTQEAYINGKMVWDFTLQPENQNSVRTLCHEMFHSAGAPDLYHYDFDGQTPAGCWDIMESGYGHMGMHMKAKYGTWIEPIPAIGPGFYTLNPVTSAMGNAYRINLSDSEYLVLEYRKQGADIFEEDLPGSGLLIYRINSTQDGNSDGPPDEVYVFRPDGSLDSNGAIAEAAFSAQNCQTSFNQYTNPSCFSVSGQPYSVNIHSISEAGETISFFVESAQAPYPPVVEHILPGDGHLLPVGETSQISAGISFPGSSVLSAEFLLDGLTLGTLYAAPYQVQVPEGFLGVGHHDILVRATSQNGLTTSRLARVRVIDPQQPTWFHWLTDAPAWEDFGRGAVPIKAAVDFDLGTEEYLVKKVAFTLAADPWGLPAQPGLVGVKINRFESGTITEQTLLDLGNVVCDLGSRFEFSVNSATVLSGQVAVVLDLHEYQNIVFDNHGPCGHSWLTEPDRPWTDALGRGIIGAADIELQLQSPNVAAPGEDLPAVTGGIKLYPNPFAGRATVSFELRSAQPVQLDIYNLRGQKVAGLLSASLPAGAHSLSWDGLDSQGRPVSSGVYFCRLQAGKEVHTRRLAVLK